MFKNIYQRWTLEKVTFYYKTKHIFCYQNLNATFLCFFEEKFDSYRKWRKKMIDFFFFIDVFVILVHFFFCGVCRVQVEAVELRVVGRVDSWWLKLAKESKRNSISSSNSTTREFSFIISYIYVFYPRMHIHIMYNRNIFFSSQHHSRFFFLCRFPF